MLTSSFQAPYSVWWRSHIWKHPKVSISALLPTSCGLVYFKIRREYVKWRRILKDGKSFSVQPWMYVIWGSLLLNFSCVSQTSLKETCRRNGWWEVTKRKINTLQILDVAFDENPVRSFFHVTNLSANLNPGKYLPSGFFPFLSGACSGFHSWQQMTQFWALRLVYLYMPFCTCC